MSAGLVKKVVGVGSDVVHAAKAGEEGLELAAKEAVESGTTGVTKGPAEAYNRSKHYGRTPTAGDRKAVGAGEGHVADHDPPLVKRYYEGDPARGEKPGWQMTADERKASASDRSRMSPQPKAESNSQGGKMRVYSREQKKKHQME